MSARARQKAVAQHAQPAVAARLPVATQPSLLTGRSSTKEQKEMMTEEAVVVVREGVR